MIPRTVPGGWYADARVVDGVVEFVVLITHSHLATSRGRVALPRSAKNGLPQNLLFVDLAPDGVTFVGVGNHDDRCWEWNGEKWTSHGEAFGPRAVMYDRTGKRHIVGRPVAHGYRYQAEDGRLVTASETAEDLDRRIWEFTELPGGLTIGQGGKGIYGEDPAIVIIDGVRRLISGGTCRFLKPRRVGDRITVAYVREDLGGAVIATYTIDELRALPLALDTQPAPPPPPPPDPVDPDPAPEPTPMDMPSDVYAILAAVAAKFHDLHKGSVDDRRTAMKRGLQTVRARIRNSERWVWKTEHPSMGEAGASKDAAGFVERGPVELMRRAEFVVWDTINGTTRAMYPAPLTGHRVTAHMIPVDPVDWLTDTQPDPTPKPDEPKPPPPSSNLPTLHQWIKVEYPQLVEIYKARHGGTDPGHEWAAFQTCRRGGVMLAPGEPAWTFEQMLAHERTQ